MEVVHEGGMDFIVRYDDGTAKTVKEGILFEVDNDEKIILNLGTDRIAVLFATLESIFAFIDDHGLNDMCEAYLDEDEDRMRAEIDKVKSKLADENVGKNVGKNTTS